MERWVSITEGAGSETGEPEMQCSGASGVGRVSLPRVTATYARRGPSEIKHHAGGAIRGKWGNKTQNQAKVSAQRALFC